MISEFSRSWELAWTQLWQVTAVIGVAALVARFGCRRRPHLAYLLWLVVLAKCWIPPVVSSPSGVFCWLSPERFAARNAALESDLPFDFQTDSSVDSSAALAAAAPEGSEPGPARRPEPLRTTFAARMSTPALNENLWPRAIVAIWLVGGVTLVAFTSLRFIVWRRKLAHSAQPPDPQITSLVAELSQRLGLRREVQVLVSSSSAGPAVFGIVRPVLVLPQLLMESADRQGLAAIVAHELIHVRRRDLLVGWMQLATQIAWWFHPLVWWSGVKLSQERERCCDEAVVAGLRCDPAAYAQTLLDVMKLRRRLRPLLSCPGIRATEVTLRRLEHIVRCGADAHARTPRTAWLAAAALFCLLAPGAAFRATGYAAQRSDEPGVSEVKGVTTAIAAESPIAETKGEAPAADSSESASQGGAEDANNNAEDVERETPAPQEQPGAKKLSAHVDRAVAFLKNEQRGDGSWPDPVGYPGGITSLCTLAMLRSGVAVDDPAIERALVFLRTLPPQMTYSTALVTMVFCEAGLDQDRKLIKRNVAWFKRGQKSEGAMAGAWGYPQAEGDHSNTGFAVMALYAADRAGVHADDEVWRRVLLHWTQSQNVNGSWGYKPGIPGTGSMTFEGIFSVTAAARVLDDANLGAGPRAALDKAEEWLSQVFSAKQNPGTHGVQGWQFYYLFAAAEAGRIAQLKTYGTHDWRQEGAAELLALQKPDGSWKGQGHAEDNSHVATSLALLFFSEAVGESE